MLTFNQIYLECQEQTQDYDATSLITIKRGINQGMHKFADALNRDWRLDERTFSTVANQQYYQLPEDCIRAKSLTVTVGSVTYTTEEIENIEEWQALNTRIQTSTVPEFHFIKGSDQIGIYPTPSGINTATLMFERATRDMTQDDYMTGTITVTAGSPAIVGSGTTFTAAMIGRTLFADPTGGTGDGAGYRIVSFTDTTHIALENNYAGATGAGKSYLIGEVPDTPEAYHESLVDYGLYRYYRRRRDLQTAKDLKAAFDETVQVAQQNYSSRTSSQYARRRHLGVGYSQIKRNLTIP